MSKNKQEPRGEGSGRLGGLFGGLTQLFETIRQLAEKGDELRELHRSDEVKGVYGFTIRTGLGGERDVKVEPFGNLHRDRETGATVVRQEREPLMDIFDEADHILVVAELPGINPEDVCVEVEGSLLRISGTSGDKKYRKEVELPAPVPTAHVTHTCRNGILEVKLVK